jgi:hypothetical protein
MPNLETKFVAANTLIDLEKKEGQLNLMGMNEEIYQKELFLKKTRQEIFYTRRYSEKKKLKVLEQKGRIELKEILLKNDFAKSEAEQMAEWNPFDPINAATFFDSMTMFGFKDGFDIIIGNPPYIFTRDADFSKDFKEYISKYYFSHLSPNEKKSKANQSGKINLFALFIMRGLFEAKKHGLLSYIVPNNLLRTTTYDLIRKYLLDNSKIEELVDLGSNVFDNVTASTIIIRISKIKFNPDHEIKIITEIKNLECCDFTLSKIEQKQFIGNISYTFNLFANSRTSNLLSKISNNKIELGKYCIDIIEGIVAHKYLINDYKTKDNEPLLEGKTIRRYGLNSIKKYITWHVNEIHRTRPDYLWASPQKIVIQRISGGLYPLTATIDNNKYKTFASVNNLLLKTEYNHEYEFFLALINSKIINWFYANSFSNNSTLTVNISKTFLEKLPIIDVSDSIKEIIKYFVCITIKTKEINQDVISEFFEQLIDAIVYELYLKEIIQNAECQILKHLTDLPELNKSYDQIKNLKIINSVYYKLKNLDHPVSVAMKKMQEIDEVKIFEGKL